MPTEPTKKRMKLPSFLKRGDAWIRLTIELKRDRAYMNYKAVARLDTIIYKITGDNERVPIEKQMNIKTFSARGGGYDKICSAAEQAISHLQQYAASQGIWLPLGAGYLGCMGWYNLDRYFRSMFKDADVVIPRDEKSNICLTAECYGVRQRPKLGYCVQNRIGRYVYYLDPYCVQSLIRYDNAELLYAIDLYNKRNELKQKTCKSTKTKE